MAIDYFQQQFGEDTPFVGPLSQVEAPDYTQMMLDRYATIGRTGVGTGASNVDKEGLDNWVRALQTGEVTPADLDSRFSTAVTDYMAQNPNDQYTNYVKDYQAKQAGTTGAKIETTDGGDIGATSNVGNAATTGALTQTNTYFQANPDVAAAYAANNSGLTPDQFASTHYGKFGQFEGRDAPAGAGTPVISAPLSLLDTNTYTTVDTQVQPNYRQMVLDAYGSIGRTGIGTEANQVDIEGADAFTKALETGQIKPEDFSRTFQTAVVDYLASKPEDKYSTYVTNYLTENKPAELSGVVDLYQDVLGRAPDPKGLADWYRQLGSKITPEGRALFENSAEAELNSRTQGLYTRFMGSGRIAEKDALKYWNDRFGNNIDAKDEEDFRNAAAAELSGAFGTGGLDAVAGFKYAKDLGISNAGLKSTLGEDLYNQYQSKLKSITTTSISDIVADNSLTFEESQKVANLARDLGYNSQQLADLTGKDKALFDTILTNYDTNRTKIINDTLTGAKVLTDADRVIASYALEKQFGFTDDDIAKATGVDVNVIKSSLNPIRNFETDFSKIANNTDSTTQQLKDFVTNAKANTAIDKLYGEALNGYENKIEELETKWSRYGSDAIQSENLYQQLNAQRNALGGQYFQGVFGDLENSAALLVKKGLDTIGDLGQKDKFITTSAYENLTTADGRRVFKEDNEYLVPITDSEGNHTGKYEKVDPSSVVKKYFKNEDDGYGNEVTKPLSEKELATLKDGKFQQKIGSVVIDKDTGAEITDLTGQLAFQESGGWFTGKKHWLNAKFTEDGTPYLTATTEKSGINAFVSEMGPMVISIAAMIPGPHQPFAMMANAAIALEQKNYLGAVLSGLNAAGSFTGTELSTLKTAEAAGDIINTSRVLDLQNTASNIKLAQTAVSGFAALQADNIAGVINSSLSAYGQTGGTLPSGLTTAMQTANLALAIKDDNLSAAMVSLGDLTNSKDLYVAASAKNLIDAFQSGNEANIVKAGIAFGNAFDASNKATKTNTNGAKVVSSTGTDTDGDVNLPSGLQLAGVTNGTTSDAGSGLAVNISGRPIFAEDSRAANLEVPFGYRILSASETDSKPAGSFLDNTTNAWMAPITDVANLGTSNLQSDIDLFNNSIGDLDRATVSSDGTSNVSSGSLDALTSYLDGTDSVSSNNSSNNSATSGLDSVNRSNSASTSNNLSNASNLSNLSNASNLSNTINAKSGLNSVSGDGIEELVITDKRPIDELVITADRPVDELVITADRPANVIVNDDNTTTTVVVDNDGKVTTHDCAAGYHWNEATQACVADAKVVTPKVNIPVVNTPTVKTPVTMTSPLSGVGTPPPVLDTSERMLKGAPAQKRMELAKLQQLFASLTPEMASVLSERGFEPPKFREDKIEETPSAKPETSIFGNLSDELYRPTFMATGGSVLESLKPKFIDHPKHLAAAPVVGTGGVDSPLKLSALKHLYQSVGRPMRALDGLAQGGLPQKYAKAAPKGHKPEFITGLTGYYATGKGTGQSDDIPAMLHDGDYVIDADAVAALGDGSSKAGAEALAEFQSKVPHSMSTGGQAVPAKIADGEYVFPEAFVSAIGEGDNKLGAKRLDAMREELRAHKRSAPTSKIPPKAKSPLDYLRMAKG